jgi:hypothetical protein
MEGMRVPFLKPVANAGHANGQPGTGARAYPGGMSEIPRGEASADVAEARLDAEAEAEARLDAEAEAAAKLAPEAEL